MFAQSSLEGSCFARSFSDLLLAGMRAHWRQLIGAALVLSDIAAVYLLANGYLASGLLIGTVVFVATFLGMYDFDGLRQGIGWTVVTLGLSWGLLLGVRSGQLGLTLMLALASAGVFYFLIRYARSWVRDYERAHPAANSDGIEFIDSEG